MVGILKDRILSIKDRISESARKSGRDPSDVILVAVTKTRTLDEILEAAHTGEISVFGENRVQEGEGKIISWPRELDVRWHLIGHLQRNKARKALDLFKCIQSVDSTRLAELIHRISEERGIPMNIFLEINTSGEASKFGFLPMEAESACLEILEKYPFLKINGLMTIGPLSNDEMLVRSSFSQLRELKEKLEMSSGRRISDLSMGMSGDYEWAIEEGSTMVRIGSALFGPRIYDRN